MSTAYYARVNRAKLLCTQKGVKETSRYQSWLPLFRRKSNFLWMHKSLLGKRNSARDTTKIEVFGGSFQHLCGIFKDNLRGSVGFCSGTIDVSTVKEWIPFMSFIASSWYCRKVRIPVCCVPSLIVLDTLKVHRCYKLVVIVVRNILLLHKSGVWFGLRMSNSWFASTAEVR